jgi:hypothetical protein
MRKVAGLGARVVLILIASGMTSAAGRADFIRIDDSKNGNPVITTDNSAALTIITISPEFVHFTFKESVAASVTNTSFRDLLESDGSVSDRFIITQTQGSPVLDLRFGSDPQLLLIQPPPGATQLTSLSEDGTFQQVFKFVSSEAQATSYLAKSDFPETGETVVPEPSSLLMALTGVGLLSIGGVRRLVRSGNGSCTKASTPSA